MNNLRVVLSGKCAAHNVLLGPPVVPIHEVQMKPCFVMATNSVGRKPSVFRGITMLMHLPKAVRTRWFEKSADVCPIVRNGSRSTQWWGARWRRQGTIRRSFVNSTEVVSAATTPSGAIIQGTIQIKLSFQNDGFLTDPSQLQGDTQPMNKMEFLGPLNGFPKRSFIGRLPIR